MQKYPRLRQSPFNGSYFIEGLYKEDTRDYRAFGPGPFLDGIPDYLTFIHVQP